MASFCINETWTNSQVCELLEEAGLDKTKFKEKGIDGVALKLTDEDLKGMGITDAKERLKYLNVIRNKNQHKVINDPIHGTIKLHPLLIRIIDTHQFQRLRNMKQLGGASFVYPGACHTRFEHSIGVAHLAGEFARALKPSATAMDDKDVLCVQIAGLCHDLGHGPFSHLFEEVFVSAKKHEDISIRLFDYLVEENGLKPLMKLYGLKDIDLTFIREMMNPKETYEGRTDDKYFLYEIVSNSTNGVDVDKFDYFARDCHYLGLQNNFDHRRYLEFARVCEADDGKTHICVRDKEVDNVYDIFQTRYRLHKRAYQHKVTKAVQLMIKDAFFEAKDLHIEGTGKKLCEASEDMAAFTKLTDHLFQQILYSDSTDPKLRKAKEILERIMSRDLYECLLETEVTVSPSAPVHDLKEKIKDLKQTLTESLEGEGVKTPEDLEIMVGKYGWKEEDPIKDTYFYSKKEPTKAFKKSQNFKTHPAHIPQSFIRVFIKNKRRGGQRITMNKDSVKRLKEWCKESGFGLQDDDKQQGEPFNMKMLKMSISNK
ncbi:deoxynucleoside triphosphate triphosphohydrolase SAMHD1-like [Betta splendens]|uniref:Deoxynucleoside triphosphate triphosphohydrolase SAMHD1 n=1 Tax=Betta splendens TaxID=158456 RepID=A0A6P7N1I5_BETSP|nr:deoxynucleoside triphosphate triphosphohydrolase SAMHD1-like [Betta splendens]XP_055366294.1 deoxynucleoside triphosphate triphosphohydrolase SAMHD1-like [Betta splendens]